jgi:hypothetical protein
MGMKRFLLVILGISLSWGTLSASERTILIGPKTIGAGWKDNIVIKPEQFKDAGPGDIMTVYTIEAKRTAQIAFQDPKDWQAVSPEYGAMSVQGPIRMKMTDEILAKIKERGLILGGHDYKIVQVTLIPAAEMVEQLIYRGPGMQMKDDWSASIPIAKGVFKDVKLGDGIKFLMSKVQPGAAIKLMDFRWNAMDPAVDGAAVGGDSYTYYINEQSQLIKLQLAGPDGICMRVGGKGYRFDKIALVSCTAEPDEDLSTAQRAPKEYKLQPGELYRGEKEFPNDWSGNLRLTAEPFQNCTENDVLVVSYTLLPGLKEAGVDPKISFRENKGKWLDITGAKEPVWMDLNGTDVVFTFDEESLDRLKTSGLVVTGLGFVLTRIELISAQ